ncbi:hypothetical protein F2Q70_00024105, partial [Brassica cretica]
SAKMFSAQNKIHKDKGVAPTDFEQEVAQAFFDLENTNQELKSDLQDLYINQAVKLTGRDVVFEYPVAEA